MVTWAAIRPRDPELASLAESRLAADGLLLVRTLRVQRLAADLPGRAVTCARGVREVTAVTHHPRPLVETAPACHNVRTMRITTSNPRNQVLVS